MKVIHELWRKGFAKQAYSDYRTYRHLCINSEIDDCQRLHYLQMLMEKTAKAHIYHTSESSSLPSTIQTSHNFIAKIIPHV